MPIDGCEAGFLDLATTVLPKYMSGMRDAIKNPKPLSDFCIRGVGVKAILRSFGRTSDFPGCYVLLGELGPFYVGISRGVIGRLRQHGRGKTHFDASLAYRMALERAPHRDTRSAAMKSEPFHQKFEEAKRYLLGAGVAFIEIPNALQLYLFEAYCAMELDTCKWNTFRTH